MYRNDRFAAQIYATLHLKVSGVAGRAEESFEWMKVAGIAGDFERRVNCNAICLTEQINVYKALCEFIWYILCMPENNSWRLCCGLLS